MPLEEPSLANIMEDLKTEKIAINNANYIDFRLQCNMNKVWDRKMQRREKMRNYNDFYDSTQ
eukprot:1245023-Amphidinium_carterae.1